VGVLLVSTYDLGRQPFGLASPAAWLRQAGVDVLTADLSREPLAEAVVQRADLIAFYLPMHTATRLAVPVIDRARALNPSATLAAYGLYAPLSSALLLDHGIDIVLGPEAEQDLVELASIARSPERQITRSRYHQIASSPDPKLPRLSFITPDRSSLPALDRYATLQMPDGSRRIAGTTEATRGCKHRCRHCPIVPVYNGQFRVVPVDVVLADIDQQIAAGAEHITFGDPDFFNGPAHACRIVEQLHARYHNVTYDVTIKIEHLLNHRKLLPTLSRTGCLFITSAVEAVDDQVLAKLEKGHTRDGFIAAASLCRQSGLSLAPTFVAFTPWTTVSGYADLLDTVDELDLVEHVAPVQWGLRLLVTAGSRLLELDDVRSRVLAFDSATLTYPWQHDDPAVDRLQTEIMEMVAAHSTWPRREVFAAVRTIASVPRTRPRGGAEALASRSTIPYLNEPWFC
jgi:radical SAM superfamily enzyme YgiQ (UPF0313 family)